MSEKTKDRLLKIWLGLSVFFILFAVGYIFFYIFKNGYKVLSWEFLRDRPRGLPLGTEGGIYPAIVGSLWLMALASLVSSVLALGTAIYVTFYCKSRRLKSLIELIIQCIAGVPSIVLGLFGYTLFVLNLGLGRSLLSSSLTLAIMIFPFIEVRVEKILEGVDPKLINSSYALGLPRYYTILHLVLPICKRKIISSISLAGGLALGASAPIMMTGAVLFADVPKDLSSPIMALPLHLYILIGEGIAMDKAYGTALVLIMILVLINLVAILLTGIKEEDI